MDLPRQILEHDRQRWHLFHDGPGLGPSGARCRVADWRPLVERRHEFVDPGGRHGALKHRVAFQVQVEADLPPIDLEGRRIVHRALVSAWASRISNSRLRSTPQR